MPSSNSVIKFNDGITLRLLHVYCNHCSMNTIAANDLRLLIVHTYGWYDTHEYIIYKSYL